VSGLSSETWISQFSKDTEHSRISDYLMTLYQLQQSFTVV